MSSKRSYLDTVNAGRQRRSYASLEQLNRSLESLEQRLERNREETVDHAREPHRAAAPAFEERAAGSAHAQPYRSIARDMERVRREEDGVIAFGRIAGELESLRDELRHQMASSMRSEFDEFRKDFGHVSAQGGKAASKLGTDVERLSGAVKALGERTDDRSINMLRLEMEQLKGALDSLAREETVLSVDRRWDDFHRRFNEFEDRVASSGQPGADLAALTERVEQIGRAVSNLPESLSLRALEDKVRTLATALDQFIGHQDGRASQTFAHIEERLDEISRAIVSATIAAQKHLDLEPFEKIEGRISALARQIEELMDDTPERDMMEHLKGLSRRIDELAARSEIPNVDEIVSGMERRFDGLSSLFERRQEDALERGNMLFRELELRLDDVAQRIDQRQSAGALDKTADAAIRGIEARLDGISRRLEESASQLAGIDPDLVRSLEAQVSSLSAHLTRPNAPLPEFVDISPRLREIERSIAENRESVMEAAREAAEAAARALAGSQPGAGAVAELAEDLKSLESLTRLSDERNSKTFEAIHDTLLKIVDRMGSLEREGGKGVGPKLEVAAPPSIDAEDIFPAVGEELAMDSSALQDAAVEPAAGKVDEKPTGEAADAKHRAGRMRSVLGGLSRAFSRKEAADTTEPEPAEAKAPAEPAMIAEPEVDLDAPLDPKIANLPLEPGSGAPDLNAIMKRVRDERAPARRDSETDAGKSDFIAAARRAAQAAAAEADARKRKPDGGPVRVLRIGELLKSRRKHLLMGATALMTALAGLQYGKAWMDGTTTTSSVAASANVVSSRADGPEMAQPASKTSATDAPKSEPATARMAGAAEELSRQAQTRPELAASFGAEEFFPAENAFAASAPMDNVLAAVAPLEPAAATIEEVPVFQIEVPVEVGSAALREAAETGDPKAFYEIAGRFAEGRGGLSVDMAEAAKWYGISAGLGFAPAQYRIANMYEKGLGVERDLHAARNWYQQAAESGNASAMHNLAVLHAMGADGQADNAAAAKWFVKAAELGVKDSQFNLGILSAKGVGMEQSLEQSYKWFALVAETGDKDAASKRDEIGKALRPEQLERARAMAELWKAKPLDPSANADDIPETWLDMPAQTAGADKKTAVRTVQEFLNRNGYDAGSADGVIGGRTKAAISQFQRDNGMDATGRVDDKLVQKLTALN